MAFLESRISASIRRRFLRIYSSVEQTSVWQSQRMDAHGCFGRRSQSGKCSRVFCPPKGCATQFKETLVLKSSRSCAILGALDILVDIGVPAEKEVIL